MTNSDLYVYNAQPSRPEAAKGADPVTTEIVRHSLNMAANQMKRSLVRTAFSSVIYEVLDFAAAIYDRDIRMLAQCQTLPMFMGTMNFCIEGAIAENGGIENFEPGDVILYNDPFGIGSHQQDASIVMPIFKDDEIVGYATAKAHLPDVGGKEPYCTDTVDVFQEGTIYPAVKIYKAGKLNEELHRLFLANSRFPRYTAGDLEALVVCVKAGAKELIKIIDRFGKQTFDQCAERMFDHGEIVVRKYLENIPDGKYVGKGMIDNNGIDDEPIPFEVSVEVTGSDITVDYSNAPPVTGGPLNCPIATTVSATRMALTYLANGGDMASEGHFRPLKVISKPNTLFHAEKPAPTFLFFVPAMRAMEAIWEAVSTAMPDNVTAGSDGDIEGAVWWGTHRDSGEDWVEGFPHPGGQGASAHGDGLSAMMHPMQAATRNTPAEVFETRAPWLLEKYELAQDSCGAGTYRSGLGCDIAYHMLDDSYVTVFIEQQKSEPWTVESGRPGRSNRGALIMPDGTEKSVTKHTGMLVPKGHTLEIRTGGGGGYGPAEERSVAAVLDDLRNGYISVEHVKKHYPHALDSDVQSAA